MSYKVKKHSGGGGGSLWEALLHYYARLSGHLLNYKTSIFYQFFLQGNCGR